MPWINLSTETDGACKICCVVMTNRYITKPDGQPYRIQEDPLAEIWNSEYLRNVRKQMLEGEDPIDCFYCTKQRDLGTPSPRDYYNEKYLSAERLALVESSAQKGFSLSAPPVSLEPRPGTLCNLRCTSCWSMSSSRVEQERKSILKSDPQLSSPLRQQFAQEVALAEATDMDWSEREQYWENLRITFPTLERIYFTGGEPVLIENNYRVLEALIELGKTETLVAFTTNLTRIDQRLLRILEGFERVEITCSIDGVGPVNEYLRFPSSWAKTEANLKTLLALQLQLAEKHGLTGKGTNLGIALMTLVQATNVEDLPNLLRWASELPARYPIGIIPTQIQGPEYLRVESLPAEFRRKMIERLESDIASGIYSEVNVAAARKIIEFLNPTIPENGAQRLQLQDYLNTLDRHRGTSHQKALPALASFFESKV
jgi:MoaA/NifB/PqqE/SkfB family radical SAM enzyme